MINDQEFLHGAAFLKLINAGERITIAHLAEIHPSIYLISSDRNQSAVLFKVSKKPKSAWSFSLSTQEESALGNLHSQYPDYSLFLALVCHRDGICCIAEERLRTVLDKNANMSNQYISVSRTPRGSYHVSGPGRQKMEQTVPQSDWPRVILSQKNARYE